MPDDADELDDRAARASRMRIVSWMVALSVAARDRQTAQGYLLELLSLCTLADVEGKEVVPVS